MNFYCSITDSNLCASETSSCILIKVKLTYDTPKEKIGRIYTLEHPLSLPLPPPVGKKNNELWPMTE